MKVEKRKTSHHPLSIEVTRGDMVESLHQVDAAVVDWQGKLVKGWGDVDKIVYARSSLKPLQAIPLVESGAAAHYALEDKEIALACASHEGEDIHVETVASWLRKIDCQENDLCCGIHAPYYPAAAEKLIRENRKPSPMHNNCSGKHTGFLSTARFYLEPLKGYVDYNHPVQQRIVQVLEDMTGVSLKQAPKGIDGCGIPVIGIPLFETAYAMARMANPAGLPPARQQAIKRIVQAIKKNPLMIGGHGRFCSILTEQLQERGFAKVGAEGVYIAVLPQKGLGIALKAADGAIRAAEMALVKILLDLQILNEKDIEPLEKFIHPVIKNRAGLKVGEIR